MSPSPPPRSVANPALADVLDRHTAPGSLWRAEGEKIRCVACGHRCLIGEGRRGICKVRFNRRGELRVPFGYVAGLQADPVEKKPFFHVYPGADALTFGMMGCDFHCPYCQNWVTSQALRDEASSGMIQTVTSQRLAETAVTAGAELVVSSYNEPLITAEWAVAVFEQARARDLLCAFVSNGNATSEALDCLAPWISAYKVDLKGFDDRRYRTLGGTLEHVKQTIEMVHARGIWLEVLTLLVPGFNDSDAELRALTSFVAGVSREIPWHVTAFHPDYKMTDPRGTRAQDLFRACEIGRAAGLHYIYAGNLPGRVGPWEDTRCPGCAETLIARRGYNILAYHLTPEGSCPGCGQTIPGVWRKGVGARCETGGSGPFYRLPRPVRLN